MNTSSTSVAEGDTRRQARRGLVVFFALVVPLTVICITTGNPFWGFPLMWSVAVASVVTRLVLREGFADVSFRFGGGRTWKYFVLAPIIPITIGLIAYGIAWTTGLARFDPQPAGLVPSLVGDTASPITIFVVILAWAATIGTITSAVSAAGEEIGWRGYMLTRMIDAGVPRRPILVSGVIWGLWHVPLILGGVLYADSPSPVLTAGLFMVLATSFAYVLARMRLETGSIWPVIALHAAYNSIIQTAFAPVTAGAGTPLWVGMEAGILVVLTTVVVAVIFSRGHWTIRRIPEAREGAGAPGSPAPQTQTKPNIHGSVVENRRCATTRGDGVSRKMTLLAAIVALVLSVAATAPASGRSANDSAKGNSAKNKDFAGLVDIGGGRKMYLECHGKGSPTVVFVSGVGDRAETWSKTLDPSKQPVLPAMAETNRVCAYDRPGTYLADGEGEEDFEKSRSDPVPQPTTLQDGVADLHALLSASGERGPYVLVGHSMGGAIARLYASEHPQDVSGLVLVDYTPYEARNGLTDEQWGYWKLLLGSPSEEALALYPDLERFDHQRNLEQALAAPPLKPMPLIVLSSDEPYDLTPYVEDGTLPADIAEEFGNFLFQIILEARADLVSQVPGAKHITDTHSGHYIHQEQPQLLIASIREVVGALRKLPESGGVGTWVAMAAALALMGCGIGAIALVRRSIT